MSVSRCDACCTSRTLCENCKENPIYKHVPAVSLFSYYTPVCPFGMDDCIYDPAYIKYHYPDWYHILYGDISPEEAAKAACGSYDDPSECYDDEDK